MSTFCKSYFNVTLDQDYPDVPQAILLGKVWHNIHRAAVSVQTKFAVAFPEWTEKDLFMGSCIRVFTETRAGAENILASLERILGQQDIAKATAVAEVPNIPSTAREWEVYLMRRLPSGVSKNRKTIPMERAQELRDIAYLRRKKDQSDMPFVWMQSSTGNRFRLVVERMDFDGESSGYPNGYGLSRSTQMVSLPMF